MQFGQFVKAKLKPILKYNLWKQNLNQSQNVICESKI